ncbi:surfeit locus 1 family protein [Aureimonas phyllosphaerae]|uniref:SURF1-like protein n=2 Tax=Aureimonas phyllosphaerae TaxID=1166078 RepID=A0A7W6BPA8_9HYPH|nr:SURF1 family protein [Aureimonas phyllosphaerae]MBB3935614.1 surfeit locus 1 family protein [Aureimonas phyllosphaerae]MBB3959622.1 surfeit locus 1 family protein [Aureimonas phyllosphaerae]
MTETRRMAPGPDPTNPAGRPRSRLSLFILGLSGLFVFAVLLVLGIWQVQRLSWKLDLIQRVEARVNAPPAAPPSPAQWAAFDGPSEEYRRVRLEGSFRNDRETFVQALTELGSGFWVMTPFVMTDGTTILVNRGFVPADRRDPATRAAGQQPGPVSITGLLRLDEPGGGFLRSNDPAADRWFSRDVAAIAERRGLGPVAPFFIDQSAGETPGGIPVGGLTVVAFRNHHLVYALTWFALATMLAGAGIWIARDERRRRTAWRVAEASR